MTASSDRPLRDLWTLLTATTASSDTFECARLTATVIPSLVPCSMSAFALLDGEDWHLVLQKEGRQQSAESAESVVKELDELLNRSTRWGDVLILSDRSIPSGIRDLGCACLAVVPVRNLRNQFGMILIGRARPTRFSQQEQYVLITLAEHLSQGLENLRLQEALGTYSEELERQALQLEDLVEERTAELHDSEQRLRALLDIETAALTIFDLDELLHAMRPVLREILPFDRTSIVLYDSEGDVFHIRSVEEAAPERRFRRGEDIPRSRSSAIEHCFALREMDIRSYPDEAKQFRFSEDRELHELGYRTIANLPLLVRDRCLGTFNGASKNQQEYSEAQLEFLSLVAGRLATLIDNANAHQEVGALRDQLQADNRYLRLEIKNRHDFDEIVGRSRALLDALEQVEAVAPTDAAVLLLGETGTGKELVARAIHDRSRRRERPLITLNCGALPSGLVESELFGHEKGAFTGALSRKLGRFELADRSTLFLDEVGEIPLEAQVKLLRVLQGAELERVGGTKTIHVDVRVIAATNRDLLKAVENGSFRADLYYRLHVFQIEVPLSAIARRTFPSSRTTSRRSAPRSWGGRSRRLRSARWHSLKPTAGRETCASSRT